LDLESSNQVASLAGSGVVTNNGPVGGVSMLSVGGATVRRDHRYWWHLADRKRRRDRQHRWRCRGQQSTGFLSQ
jgi:hypothetical protein